jgi:hypothetical protein
MGLAGPFNMTYTTSFLIPMGGIEREWKANFRFRFCRARRNDSQVPNISIYGNRCPTIPKSRRSGCVLHRKFEGSFRVRLNHQEQLVVPGMWNCLSYMIPRLTESILPDTRWASICVKVMGSPTSSPSRIWRTTNSCIDGAKVGQMSFPWFILLIHHIEV